MHGILGAHSLISGLRAWTKSNNYCPTCHQRLRRCDSPEVHGVLEVGQSSISVRNERMGDVTPVANPDGSSEDNRLIIPAEDEA